jgi:hypothetical protein
MITFKINGNKFQIPTCWPDVTYSQYIALLTLPNSLIHYINLFTGIPIETLEKAELKNLEKISIALSFLKAQAKFEQEPTRMVGSYVLPKDVTIKSLGQFEDLRALLYKVPSEVFEKIKNNIPMSPQEGLMFSDLQLEACAIYAQKVRDGVYDPERVPKVKEELKNYSCIEVIQTGAFFLFRPHNTSLSTPSRSQRISLRLKKWLLVLLGYLRSLDSRLHSSTRPKG